MFAVSGKMITFASGIVATAMDKKVLENIRQVLMVHLPKGAEAILYGSQARGDARHDSDWDILIVLDKDKLLPSDYDTVTYPLAKLGWDLGTEINPIMYTIKPKMQGQVPY